jgi:hypothetical protein
MNDLAQRIASQLSEMRADVETLYRTTKEAGDQIKDAPTPEERDEMIDSRLLSLSAANLLRAFDDFLMTTENMLVDGS